MLSVPFRFSVHRTDIHGQASLKKKETGAMPVPSHTQKSAGRSCASAGLHRALFVQQGFQAQSVISSPPGSFCLPTRQARLRDSCAARDLGLPEAKALQFPQDFGG